jgi:hypothetical protein
MPKAAKFPELRRFPHHERLHHATWRLGLQQVPDFMDFMRIVLIGHPRIASLVRAHIGCC